MIQNTKKLRNFISIGVTTFALFFFSPSSNAQHGAESLCRSGSQMASTSVEIPLPRSRRRQWNDAAIASNLDAKQQIAEDLGDAGVRLVARTYGYLPLLTDAELSYHGPDFPTLDPTSGVVHIFEGKGGRSAIKKSHGGHPQGSPENAVEFYKKLFKNPKATDEQRRVAAFILQQASQGKIIGHVVRVEHVQGQPYAYRLQDFFCQTKVQKIASKFLASSEACKALGVAGTIGGIVQISESARDLQNGNIGAGVLQATTGGADLVATGAALAGETALAETSGAVGIALDGIHNIYSGCRDHDAEKLGVGTIKIGAAAAVGTGLVTCQPEVVIGGAIVYGVAVVGDLIFGR